MTTTAVRWIAGAAALWLLASPADSCTTFVLRDGGLVLFGKNYDWSIGDGMLVANPRGLQRTALVAPNVRGASWTSRYGSLTFDQYGLGSPSGGINEAGLVVELMWLEGGRYPAPDGRPAIGNLEWIQYQLDRHATVEEVIASDDAVRIEDHAPLHYLVADRQGGVAVIEFLDGEMHARRGDEVPVPALANDTYASSLASWQKSPDGDSRFARAGRRALRFHASGTRADSIAYAFATLGSVAQPSTQWSIVYDLAAGEVFFRTKGRQGVRRLALGDLDLTCSQQIRAVDLAGAETDLATVLQPLTLARHRRMLGDVYRKTPFLAQTSSARLDLLASHPLAARCASTSGPGAASR